MVVRFCSLAMLCVSSAIADPVLEGEENLFARSHPVFRTDVIAIN